MEFIGHNKLSAMLRWHDGPRRALRGGHPPLHERQLTAAVEVMNRYSGDFVYVHVWDYLDFSTFLVRALGGPIGYRVYEYHVHADDLPDGWTENVPTIEIDEHLRRPTRGYLIE